MRKNLPYIILFVVVLLLGVIIVSGSRHRPRRMDEHITLRQRDQIPYGTAATKSLLTNLFPRTAVSFDTHAPGEWTSIIPTSYNQAVVLVCDYFNADRSELYELLQFIQNGNYVFLMARSFSNDAQQYFGFNYSQNGLNYYTAIMEDSLTTKLESPPFSSASSFVYPGINYSSWFYSLDTARTIVLGRDEANRPNFIQMRRGSGALFIHAAPLAFSNYFILHKDNIHFFEKAFSLIPPNVDKLVWNEYYLTKPSRSRGNDEPGWLKVLFRYPPFKWGLLTILATLFLMVLLGMRRQQRMIPVHQKPRNDSLDFVKTMGRLYHERRDHQNLAKKMSVYFLEHVRSTFKLPTQELDETFTKALLFKSGHPEEQVREIVAFTRYLQSGEPVTEENLIRYHKLLELFYQNT
jgi:hypothetical protein